MSEDETLKLCQPVRKRLGQIKSANKSHLNKCFKGQSISIRSQYKLLDLYGTYLGIKENKSQSTTEKLRKIAIAK